ncbi:MAG: hypothetical protein A3208_06430 [Candidatus Methanoprimaticola hominis]|nr:MAG: hypothetical protein A3208_06430 [Methanomassiliicoccales archaeon Mx-06]
MDRLVVFPNLRGRVNDAAAVGLDYVLDEEGFVHIVHVLLAQSDEGQSAGIYLLHASGNGILVLNHVYVS